MCWIKENEENNVREKRLAGEGWRKEGRGKGCVSAGWGGGDEGGVEAEIYRSSKTLM